MAGDNIEKMYKCYEILSEAKDKIHEHEKEYRELINAVKGSAKEKRLASQFVGKFFKHFPSLADLAIDGQLDLCEDEDAQIRRQAIKDLPHLCKDNTDHTARIGDILAQLLVLEDVSELQQVHMSLQTLAKYDAKGTLDGIIGQIMNGEEPTRERCLRYLATKFRLFGAEIITKEIEALLIIEVKKILQDVTADEFHLCMNILGNTVLGRTVTGHAELVKLTIEQAELDAELDLSTIEEVVERYIHCATHALPYFSSQVESTPFIKFMCSKFLTASTWQMIIDADQQDQIQLRLLKVFAEMCTTCGTLEAAAEHIENVFQVLIKYMPLPPQDGEINETPSFQFSHAECLLYSIHSIGKQAPDFLIFQNDSSKLKDFRSRLQYLARGTQGYIRTLQEAIKGKTTEELQSDENKIKVTALKTTSNISSLIRDLFHTPPSYKTTIHMSWIIKKDDKAGNKRHAPITFGGTDSKEKPDNAKKTKSSSDQRVYTPPSGKYSGKVQNYNNNTNNSNQGGRNRGSNNRYRNSKKNFRRY